MTPRAVIAAEKGGGGTCTGRGGLRVSKYRKWTQERERMRTTEPENQDFKKLF